MWHLAWFHPSARPKTAKRGSTEKAWRAIDTFDASEIPFSTTLWKVLKTRRK